MRAFGGIFTVSLQDVLVSELSFFALDLAIGSLFYIVKIYTRILTALFLPSKDGRMRVKSIKRYTVHEEGPGPGHGSHSHQERPGLLRMRVVCLAPPGPPWSAMVSDIG